MVRARRSNRLQQLGLGLIVGLIVLAFVFVFGQPQSRPGGDAVLEVDGERVSLAVFDSMRRRIDRGERPQLPEGTDEAEFERQLDALALELVLQRVVLAQRARGLGLSTGDAEIEAEIRSLFCSGLLPSDCAAQVAAAINANYGGDRRAFTEDVRRDLLIRKLTRLLSSPLRIASRTLREQLLRDRLEVRLRYVALRADDFQAGITVSDDEARGFVAAEPERIKAAYDRRTLEFHRPEQVRARHILFRGEDALSRAQVARSRLDQGEDFVEIAREVSDDPATRELGGDLGFIPRGVMKPPFEEAAFGAEPATVVGPVATDEGQHLIRIEERQAAIDRSLEEVSELLARDLLVADRATDAARSAAAGLAGKIREGASLRDAAAGAALDVDETIFFRPAEAFVPGIGRLPGLGETAASLTEENPSSHRVFGTGGSFYLVALAERREPDPADIEASLENAREELLLAAREASLSDWYRTRREELESAGRIQRYALRGN